ncbi:MULTISPECIES: ankyrin repeat domain-containing protein [unclassified Oceanispirochaeta]|uniref:ankyrin repeat domain-containing protein n=1 Tax=unclassified Oceanispirochaeta TaxID=2635722 RepID=UPI000E0917C0|nr:MULTISPECIES: ankyrin repeat domain-containing protein [unclassified Oceanispirochaeta]MBF9014780.1 ankyrin repeat domain-containing protein [Oceanispirochaeta sp. M2]NPD71036.1 ankyrin repeat domain-containing protein [Oceanispirochaeta sp. M1]RDG33869.1 ankyrin repeat domain-containing protein [Oceanispirochaeta sp. M1]
MLSLTHEMKEEIKLACMDMPDGEINRMIRRGISAFRLLVLGCQTNSVPLMLQAIDMGADINGRDQESWTPLMHATYYNNHEAIDYLLYQNVMIHTRSDQGESAVYIAQKERNESTVNLFNDRLYKIRMKHAGILIEALKTIEEERKKPAEARDRRALALSCIDRAYVWWVGEEHPEKVIRLFCKAYQLDPRVGAFPYASILASSGKLEESLDILELIQRRHWTTIPREGMVESGLFVNLEESPRWKRVLKRWPLHS